MMHNLETKIESWNGRLVTFYTKVVDPFILERARSVLALRSSMQLIAAIKLLNLKKKDLTNKLHILTQ